MTPPFCKKNCHRKKRINQHFIWVCSAIIIGFILNCPPVISAEIDNFSGLSSAQARTQNTPQATQNSTTESPNLHKGIVPGCAVDTMNIHINQAVMETRRETAANQTLIYKADSVLDYGCFEDMLKTVENNTAPLFSENTHWAPKTIDLLHGVNFEMNLKLPANSMDTALTIAARGSMQPYLQSNFNHAFLNNRSGIQRSGNCSVMNQVWDKAKCENADIKIPPKEGAQTGRSHTFSQAAQKQQDQKKKFFYEYSDLVSFDPRSNDMQCAGQSGKTAIEQSHVDMSNNKDHQHSTYSKPENYAAQFLTGDSCNLTIQTGIPTRMRKGSSRLPKTITFQDGFCPNPACAYLLDDETGKCEAIQAGGS